MSAGQDWGLGPRQRCAQGSCFRAQAVQTRDTRDPTECRRHGHGAGALAALALQCAVCAVCAVMCAGGSGGRRPAEAEAELILTR